MNGIETWAQLQAAGQRGLGNQRGHRASKIWNEAERIQGLMLDMCHCCSQIANFIDVVQEESCEASNFKRCMKGEFVECITRVSQLSSTTGEKLMFATGREVHRREGKTGKEGSQGNKAPEN